MDTQASKIRTSSRRGRLLRRHSSFRTSCGLIWTLATTGPRAAIQWNLSKLITIVFRICTSKIASATMDRQVPFGEGNTPIKQVLQLLQKKKYSIPAFVEYEYPGKSGPL